MAGGLVGALATVGILSSPGDATSDNAPRLDWPKRQQGKYVCAARAQGLNCDGNRAYGFGFGVGNNLAQAQSMARRQALGNIPPGFSNIHNVSFKCIGKKGDRISPHK